MKHKINIESWNRKEHFNFFKQFENPYYGVTAKVDCTQAYLQARQAGVSFFNYYLHKTMLAVNSVEYFRYRIEGDEVYSYDSIDVSATILRDDHTFGFSNIKFHEDFDLFDEGLKAEIERIKNATGLFTTGYQENIIHFSALPWIDFSSISQPFSLKAADSCPKISVGKLVDSDGKKEMSFTVYVNHALVDGYHLGQFYTNLQEFLNQ
ncbi:chloramphenicol acetyltransferase [Mucilaginibacter sp. Bleaf8]|uniref:chloramphenicol acetyltransferase n=1 Tax=Mucilaginibacter sp. Bleaf8 TaxID=2834430 RepID=UPI001BCE4584|nr:chloramphenicol acetyltransferase [Mucilaginibacter sp. Bleaf8]MBS7564838.1 chloramphenicol acetyltransferase [Mucilaginibacter sp. Bleaf8]